MSHYDLQGRLAGVDSDGNGQDDVTLLYGPSGVEVGEIIRDSAGDATSRIDRLVDENTLGGYSQVRFETTTDLTVSPHVVTSQTNYLLGDRVLGQATSQGGATTVSYLLVDSAGSTRQLAAADGTIVQSYDYDAFGGLTDKALIPATAILYTGQQWNAALGDYNLRARHYDPISGRFDSRDPLLG